MNGLGGVGRRFAIFVFLAAAPERAALKLADWRNGCESKRWENTRRVWWPSESAPSRLPAFRRSGEDPIREGKNRQKFVDFGHKKLSPRDKNICPYWMNRPS